MRRYQALCEEWAKRPPTRWLKAAQLQYKPPSKSAAADGRAGPMPKLRPTRPRSPAAEERLRQIVLAARARGEPTIALPGEEGHEMPEGVTDLNAWLKRNGGSWRG